MAVLANSAYQAGVRPHTESTPRHAYGTHQSQSYTSNPLPVPPQQISTGLMAIHPYTSTTPRADPRSRAASITGQHGATVNPNRTNTVRSEAESIVAPGFNPIASSESYRNTSTRPPLMVPGAPHNERVIPPLPPGEFAKEVKEFGRAFSFVPFQRPPMGGFHYGYKPGVGFCWYNTDQEQNITATGSTTRAPYHVAGNDGASGAYPSGGGYPAANVMGTAGWPDVGNTTSANDAPRNDYSQNETYVGQYPSSAAGRSHYIPNPNGSAAADAEFDYRANANGNNDTSPAFGNQLGMPAGSARGPSPVIPPPPPPPIIFNTPGNTPPPEPSPASTWGTVSSHHSSHASSRADSMANLGLTGLPAFAFPVVEDALASSSEGENAPDGTTPRVRWASHRDRRSSRPQASEPAADAHPSPGLGLQTDPGTSHSSSRQVITHPHDLESPVTTIAYYGPIYQ
ncbi:hypothetical protein A0H81_01983 [Grifola frondosa]|uniref:Uncharacterized protein n=1 Tax=Grifola frondosa TaxID=5627 RepID=A0A1C7MTU7_GRIFR|nr:hypothetical protein A0H81_01983 [Grifola frondosa]